jgi:hypothetical protein
MVKGEPNLSLRHGALLVEGIKQDGDHKGKSDMI